MLVKKCMKRSCTLSHPSHQTLKTLHGLLLFFLHILCFTWKVTKNYCQAPLLHSWTQCSGSPQSPTQGDTLHWLSEKHTRPSKNKSLFLNASFSRFLAFSLVNTAQMWQLEWNSFQGLSLSTKWWLCVPSFFPYSHDDSLIPFFGFCSPLFPFQHFSFNFCIAAPVDF